MDTDALRRLQEERLVVTLQRAYDRVPFYRRRLRKNGWATAPLAALKELPFTTKADLAAHDPHDWLAVGRDKIAEVHTTSGTSGEPTITFLTRRDVDTWSGLVARVLRMAGVRRGDLIFTLSSFGLSVGGFAWLHGARRLGAGLVPAGPGNTVMKLRLMRRLQPTVFIAPPSYSLYLARLAEERGIDLARTLRASLHGAEPWSEAARTRIQQCYGTEAFDQYGFTELFGPGVGVECSRHEGLHIFTDHFVVEVVDPSSGEPLEAGQVGELVFTSLTREAVPLIRYRTRDLSRLITEPCACGSPFPRIARVLGRSDHVVFYRAVKIFPIQIEEAILKIPELKGNYQVMLTREDSRDVMTVKVESADTSEVMRGRVQEEIRASLGVQPDVELVNPVDLHPAADRTPKLERIIDLRGSL
jgi:phenylacetate-CoA ligase